MLFRIYAHDPSGMAKVALIALMPFTIVFVWTAGDWLDHALAAPHGEELHHAHSTAMVLASTLLAIGLGFALLVFLWAPRRGKDLAGSLATALRPVHTFCSELWYFDKLWDLVFTRGLGRSLAALTARLDLGSSERLQGLEAGGRGGLGGALSLDGLVDGIGRACGRVGRGGALVHGGRLGVYLAIATVIGAFGLLWGLLR